MARQAIEIVIDAKKRLEKDLKQAKAQPFLPFEAANIATAICSRPRRNNKSEHIKDIARAAAYLLCEIETIQAIKGDGIIKQ